MLPRNDYLHQLEKAVRRSPVTSLLGPRQCGKTTLARLVFRLYDPTAGQVTLGGIDISRLKLKALRRRVALVTQDVQLFQASVRDNLTFFDTMVPDARIQAAGRW